VLTPFELIDVVGGRGVPVASAEGKRRQAIIGPDLVYDIVVHRTGVRFFVGYSQFGQQLEYALGLYFQLSSQLVNSNLHRSALFALLFLTSEQHSDG